MGLTLRLVLEHPDGSILLLLFLPYTPKAETLDCKVTDLTRSTCGTPRYMSKHPSRYLEVLPLCIKTFIHVKRPFSRCCKSLW